MTEVTTKNPISGPAKAIQHANKKYVNSTLQNNKSTKLVKEENLEQAQRLAQEENKAEESPTKLNQVLSKYNGFFDFIDKKVISGLTYATSG